MNARSSWLAVSLLLAACSPQDSGGSTQAMAPAAEPATSATAPEAAPAQAMPASPGTVATVPPGAASAPTSAATVPTPPVASAPPDQSTAPDQAHLAHAAEPSLLPAAPAPDTPAPAPAPAPVSAQAKPATHIAMTAVVAHPTPAAAAHISTASAQNLHLATTHYAALAAQFNKPTVLKLPGSAPQRTYSLRLGNVGISNLDRAMRVNFAMKMPDADWTNQALDANDTREFICGGMSEQQVLSTDCLFWMQTGGKPAVYYRIQSNERYAIFWDDTQALWDLRVAR